MPVVSERALKSNGRFIQEPHAFRHGVGSEPTFFITDLSLKGTNMPNTNTLVNVQKSSVPLPGLDGNGLLDLTGKPRPKIIESHTKDSFCSIVFKQINHVLSHKVEMGFEYLTGNPKFSGKKIIFVECEEDSYPYHTDGPSRKAVHSFEVVGNCALNRAYMPGGCDYKCQGTPEGQKFSCRNIVRRRLTTNELRNLLSVCPEWEVTMNLGGFGV